MAHWSGVEKWWWRERKVVWGGGRPLISLPYWRCCWGLPSPSSILQEQWHQEKCDARMEWSSLIIKIEGRTRVRMPMLTHANTLNPSPSKNKGFSERYIGWNCVLRSPKCLFYSFHMKSTGRLLQLLLTSLWLARLDSTVITLPFLWTILPWWFHSTLFHGLRTL